MNIRVYADEAGETHFEELHLPIQMNGENGQLIMQALTELPVTKLSITEMSRKAAPNGFHATAPRKVIAVLQGTFQVTNTSGEVKRLGPGDCYFTDHLGSKGHSFEDVGEEPLRTMIVEVSDDWEYPAA